MALLFHHYPRGRAPLYFLVWVLSVVELGLTGFRVHHTKRFLGGGFYDPIIVELLVTSALTILWVPFSISLLRPHFSNNATAAGGISTAHPGESVGFWVLWIMWLVGAAITTNTWPKLALCGGGAQCHVIFAIEAIAWFIFGFLTISGILMAMQHAIWSHTSGSVAPRGVAGRSDKPVAV